MNRFVRNFGILFGILVTASSVVVGCSGASETETAEDDATSAVKLLEAKLYDEPNATPSPSCDRYTQLTVSKGKSGRITAKIENRLGATSSCEIFVEPNPRSFTVTKSESCGSTIYEGTRAGEGIHVQDNRTRMCEDIRPSQIEVTLSKNGSEYPLYGTAAANTNPGAGDAGSAPVSKVLDVKLYDEPHAEITPSCDRYVKLVIGKEGSKLVANVKNELSPTSGCEIFVQPNERTYDVTASESCGSKIYEGHRGSDALRVQDNATRLCEDLRPARVEVSETRGGHEASYFSNP